VRRIASVIGMSIKQMHLVVQDCNHFCNGKNPLIVVYGVVIFTIESRKTASFHLQSVFKFFKASKKYFFNKISPQEFQIQTTFENSQIILTESKKQMRIKFSLFK